MLKLVGLVGNLHNKHPLTQLLPAVTAVSVDETYNSCITEDRTGTTWLWEAACQVAGSFQALTHAIGH